MSGIRQQLPTRRSGHTTAVTIGLERFSVTANQRDDGSLCEVFIHSGKHGTSSAGLMAAYAAALSTGLLHRVPLADLIRPGLGQYFLPNGHTDDPDIPRVRSVADYVGRRLAIDWLPYPERAALGVYTLTERVRRWQLAAGLYAPGLAQLSIRRASSPALITSSTSRMVAAKSRRIAASSGSAS